MRHSGGEWEDPIQLWNNWLIKFSIRPNQFYYALTDCVAGAAVHGGGRVGAAADPLERGESGAPRRRMGVFRPIRPYNSAQSNLLYLD
jgi:hypothetical protein